LYADEQARAVATGRLHPRTFEPYPLMAAALAAGAGSSSGSSSSSHDNSSHSKIDSATVAADDGPAAAAAAAAPAQLYVQREHRPVWGLQQPPHPAVPAPAASASASGATGGVATFVQWLGLGEVKENVPPDGTDISNNIHVVPVPPGVPLAKGNKDAAADQFDQSGLGMGLDPGGAARLHRTSRLHRGGGTHAAPGDPYESCLVGKKFETLQRKRRLDEAQRRKVGTFAKRAGAASGGGTLAGPPQQPTHIFFDDGGGCAPAAAEASVAPPERWCEHATAAGADAATGIMPRPSSSSSSVVQTLSLPGYAPPAAVSAENMGIHGQVPFAQRPFAPFASLFGATLMPQAAPHPVARQPAVSTWLLQQVHGSGGESGLLPTPAGGGSSSGGLMDDCDDDGLRPFAPTFSSSSSSSHTAYIEMKWDAKLGCN
jgi:hypothetical protein